MNKPEPGKEAVLFRDDKGQHYLLVYWPGDGWRALRMSLTSSGMVTTDITSSTIPDSARGDPPKGDDRERIFGIWDETGLHLRRYGKDGRPIGDDGKPIIPMSEVSRERLEFYRRCQVIEDKFMAASDVGIAREFGAVRAKAECVAYGARLAAMAIKSRQAGETFGVPDKTDEEWLGHALETVERPDVLDELKLHPSWENRE